MPLGRTYPSERNPDGTFNVRGVPIFAETTKEIGGKKYTFTREWIEEALANMKARAAEGNYSPLRVVRHIGNPQAPPIPAGKFCPISVAESVIDGETVLTLYADFLEVPPYPFSMMERGEVSWVSMEAFDVEERVIDGVTCLDASTAPSHVPFPLFRAAKPINDVDAKTCFAESPSGAFAKGQAKAAGWGTVASFAFEKSRAALGRFDAMPAPKTPADPSAQKPGETPDPKAAAAGGEQPGAKPAPVEQEKPKDLGGDGDGGVSKIVDAMLASKAFKDGLAAQVKDMLAALTGGAGPGEGNDGPHDQGKPEPKPQGKGAAMSKDVTDLAAMHGRLDVLESQAKARKDADETAAAIDACLGRLERFNLGEKPREALFAKVKEHGLGYLVGYEESVRSHGSEAPPAVGSAAFAKTAAKDLPEAVLKFTGPDLEKAIRFSKEYAELRARGMLKDIDLATHLDVQINGFGN